jgi:hypothetical protein
VSGTIAMVVVPASLLCEIPDVPPAERQAGPRPAVAAVPTSQPRAGRAPVHAAPAIPRQDLPASEHAEALPRREPKSVRPPARRPRPGPRPAQPEAAPDPVADGFAFADDLRAFSAAVSSGQRGGNNNAGADRPGDAEGHRT